jgi:hypothetical protein
MAKNESPAPLAEETKTADVWAKELGSSMPGLWEKPAPKQANPNPPGKPGWIAVCAKQRAKWTDDEPITKSAFEAAVAVVMNITAH